MEGCSSVVVVGRNGCTKVVCCAYSRQPGDLPLSPEGVKMARELLELWSAPRSRDCRAELLGVDMVISSPSTRAVQTALVAFQGLPALEK